ncbi:GNAT family N-acetyltransferase [Chryseobacterium elymi]|uniref:GNAT family N-acetyltransferase n=1 Tax=Chryseobacterium elymi TaxID=395936 RepID=A0A3D9DHN4_9FLAO|nr:GNAT family N-acetyltransferase [Chryseobacterium elymi]REC77524.1 GNAT family N-acetyltransferase [Chryseobacterium elymi]
MNIQYRKLLPEESKIYRAIRLESLKKFPESFCADYEEALKTEKFRIEYNIENQLEESFVVGAFSEGQLIGICTFVKDENGRGNIYQMYVKEEYQGKNIGLNLIRKIIKEADDQFKDIEIYLEVKNNNTKAFNLYKKVGFVETPDAGQMMIDSSILMKYSQP